MSITRSVSLVGNTAISPPEPAAAMAAFAVTVPVGAFNVETPGWGWPAGHTVRYPSGPRGTAVRFREYSCALDGMLQEDACRIGKSRSWPPDRNGPPSGPGGLRVSATRQGGRR